MYQIAIAVPLRMFGAAICTFHRTPKKVDRIAAPNIHSNESWRPFSGFGEKCKSLSQTSAKGQRLQFDTLLSHSIFKIRLSKMQKVLVFVVHLKIARRRWSPDGARDDLSELLLEPVVSSPPSARLGPQSAILGKILVFYIKATHFRAFMILC